MVNNHLIIVNPNLKLKVVDLFRIKTNNIFHSFIRHLVELKEQLLFQYVISTFSDLVVRDDTNSHGVWKYRQITPVVEEVRCLT